MGIVEVNVRIGAHMSIAGGYHRALVRGNELGCEAIQIFTKSPGNWAMPELAEEEVSRWGEAVSRTEITPVIAHDCYLVNLASGDRTLRDRSIDTLGLELERASTLGITLFVIHPGAHTGIGEREGLRRIAEALDVVIDRLNTSRVTILLETTAGQGTSLGYCFAHLGTILDACAHSDNLGVCLDTCHLFASGYDISNREGYARVMRELDEMIGLERVKAVHVNDSKRELGCRVDRHEHIGKGKIGLEGIACFLTDERLSGRPFILETPKGINDRMDRRNMKILRQMRDSHLH